MQQKGATQLKVEQQYLCPAHKNLSLKIEDELSSNCKS
jgi:hypothetical protein